jgi:hypothetical protein
VTYPEETLIDLHLDAAAMVACALASDAEGLLVVGEENQARLAPLVGTLVALCASVLKALPPEQAEQVLESWRRP